MNARTLLIAASAFFTISLSSCQDSKEESELLNDDYISTKLENISEYYLFQDIKIPIEKDNSRTHITFKGENMESLLKKLEEDGIKISDIRRNVCSTCNWILFTEFGEKWEQDQYCAALDIDFETARKYPEIDRADAYYFLGMGSLEKKQFDLSSISYALTPFATVRLKSINDLPILKDMLEKLGAEIYCTYAPEKIGCERVFQVMCNTKDGLNAVDIANALDESKKFEYAQPVFNDINPNP